MVRRNPIVAVDIDDVLAPSAEVLVAYSNRRWGTNLTVEDYNEHWGEMWQVDHQETEKRAVEWHESGEIGKYLPHEAARDILRELSRYYDFKIITSRRTMIASETLHWLRQHYEGIFSEVRFTGFHGTQDGHTLTKAELCVELGASYIIDDQLKHCLGAAKEGITALLFGDYAWNRINDQLPHNVVRVHDWQTVKEFLDAERSRQ